MKTILITGIAGSGGSYLAEHLNKHFPESEIHGISRWHSTASHKNLKDVKATLHECDLTDYSCTLYVLNKVKPDVIFHLASYANVRASFDTPLSTIQNNVMGTANLLAAIMQAGLRPKIHMCSTSEVYGQVLPHEVPIKESAPLRASSPYAVSKVAQDLLGLTYFNAYGLHIVRTRMFTYINPRRADLFATAFARQIALIEAGKLDVLRHGNLDSLRTVIDVRDAMDAYVCAALDGQPGEVYNIGGTTSVSVGDFLEVLKGLSTTKIECVEDPKLLRPSDVTLQIPDTTRFTMTTGWRPKYKFEETVSHLLDHCRKEVGL